MSSNKSGTKFIKETTKETTINNSSVSRRFDYPLFCFKYLDDASIKDCKDPKFFFTYLMRLKSLSELGWKGIRTSSRHSYGMERIPVSQIKKDMPSCITPDIKKLDVFRATGNNLPFIGLQLGNIFRIFFIETKFGDIYDH